MARGRASLSAILSFLSLLAFIGANEAGAGTMPPPTLKWQHGGCYASWCETGWYSSPAVADLDGDGTMEVIGSAYSIVVVEGGTGSLLWRAKSGHDRTDPDADNEGRTWPGVVIADVDSDAELEIVTAHGNGWVSVYDAQGFFDSNGWPWRNPSGREFRSVAVGDLDGNGDMEIVVGRAELDAVNVWVLEHTGKIRNGWPQLQDSEGSAAGLYNDNIGLGDLDGDGLPEVIVPSDTITVCAYRADGRHLETNEMYHDHPGHDMDHWGEVPAYVDLEYEIRGWGPCYDEFTPRANFANGPANVVDVNGDGVNEVVVIGDVHNCHTSPYTDLYNGPYIFNADRSRFHEDGFDWTALPTDTGAPLIQDWNVIENVQPNPVTVDLDGDGRLEIIYPSYDGRMHAFWLDKTEHGNWPYSIYDAAEGLFRLASEPAVADLDDDGHAEVIFASWVEKGTNRTGHLHILDHLGNPLHKVELPPPFGSSDWNGALAAPTLADLDDDPELELVVNTAHSGLVAYDLPGTHNARILWGTGRGSYLRAGVARQTAPILAGADLISQWERLSINGPDKRGSFKVKGQVNVTNRGNQASQSCVLEVYYPAVGQSILKSPLHVPGLEPGKGIERRFRARGLDIITGAPSSFVATVDAGQAVDESDEGNNSSIWTIEGLDIRGEWLEVTTRRLKNDKYKVVGKYSVASDVPTGGFSLQIYHSADNALDAGDTPLLKKPRKVRRLDGGKGLKGRIRHTFPSDPAGQYLILELDMGHNIPETNEANNEIPHVIP